LVGEERAADRGMPRLPTAAAAGAAAPARWAARGACVRNGESWVGQRRVVARLTWRAAGRSLQLAVAARLAPGTTRPAVGVLRAAGKKTAARFKETSAPACDCRTDVDA
jgi:hypothetical protein